MARPAALDLTRDDLPWREVPMEGADRGIDVVPLASHRDDLVMLARFPAGFVRGVEGGYHAAETFLVLEGSLELGGRIIRAGELAYVPGEFVRSAMSAPAGCTALAWFSGPATFLPPSELDECVLPLRTVQVAGAATGLLLSTPEADWHVVESFDGETVDVAMTVWALAGTGGPGPHLARSRR